MMVTFDEWEDPRGPGSTLEQRGLKVRGRNGAR